MATVTDEGLFAALSSGIGEVGGTSTPAPETVDDETDTAGGGEDAAGDEMGAGEGGDDAAGDGTGGEQSGDGDDDAAGAEGGEDGGADASGPERDPVTGKFVAKKKDDKKNSEGDGGDLGPDGKPAAKPAAGKDPVNDPIPQGLKKETQERMVALVNTAKALTAERDQYKTAYQEHIQYIQESGATPEQYSQAIDYLRMVNSGDPAQIEKCIAFMQTELAALSKLLGKPVAGVDLLADHPDLRQEVADGAISRQRAEEIAAARNNQAMRADHARYMQEQNTAAQRAEQERRQYMAELNDLEKELMASDPQYAAKRPGIIAALRAKNPATGKSLIESTPPAKWQALFLRHYALAKVPAPAPAPRQGVSNVPRNQPLRARQPAGGQAAAPKSMLDALNQGMAEAEAG
jgi:hypothetical protein